MNKDDGARHSERLATETEEQQEARLHRVPKTSRGNGGTRMSKVKD